MTTLDYEKLRPLAEAVAKNPANTRAVEALQKASGMVSGYVDGKYGPGTAWVTAAIVGPTEAPQPIYSFSQNRKQWWQYLLELQGPPPFLSDMVNGKITLPPPPPQSHETWSLDGPVDRSVLGVPRTDERPVAPKKETPAPTPEELDPEVDEVLPEIDLPDEEVASAEEPGGGGGYTPSRKKSSAWPWLVGTAAFGIGMIVFATAGKKKKR